MQDRVSTLGKNTTQAFLRLVYDHIVFGFVFCLGLKTENKSQNENF